LRPIPGRQYRRAEAIFECTYTPHGIFKAAIKKCGKWHIFAYTPNNFLILSERSMLPNASFGSAMARWEVRFMGVRLLR
jgi:hypothetical protein